jgi:hypothetical protein
LYYQDEKPSLAWNALMLLVALGFMGVGVVACDGSQSESGELTGMGGCCETRTPLDGVDQVVTELGFSASEILAFAAGEHATVLRWLPSDAVTYGPESGDVPLSVSVRYAGGPVDFVQSTEAPTGTSFPSPADALAIAVELEVTTDGGALAEVFTGELRASSVLTATLMHMMELDMLGGTFEVLSVDGFDGSGSAELTQPRLRIDFSDEGTVGRFEALLLEPRAPGVATGGNVEFARWPAETRP